MCLAEKNDTLTEEPDDTLKFCGLAQIFHFIRRLYFCITGQAYIPGCWAGQFKFPLILYFLIFNYQFWKIIRSCHFFLCLFLCSLLFLSYLILNYEAQPSFPILQECKNNILIIYFFLQQTMSKPKCFYNLLNFGLVNEQRELSGIRRAIQPALSLCAAMVPNQEEMAWKC